MHALVLLCIKQHTKFDAHNFTNYICNCNKIKKNGSRNPDHVYYGVVCYPKAILPACKIWQLSLSSRCGDMIASVEIEHVSRNTDHTHFRGGLSSKS